MPAWAQPGDTWGPDAHFIQASGPFAVTWGLGCPRGPAPCRDPGPAALPSAIDSRRTARSRRETSRVILGAETARPAGPGRRQYHTTADRNATSGVAATHRRRTCRRRCSAPNRPWRSRSASRPVSRAWHRMRAMGPRGGVCHFPLRQADTATNANEVCDQWLFQSRAALASLRPYFEGSGRDTRRRAAGRCLKGGPTRWHSRGCVFEMASRGPETPSTRGSAP